MVLAGADMLIQYSCIAFGDNLLHLRGGLWDTAANLLGIGLGAVFRFWSYRRWVWQAPLARAGASRAEAGQLAALPAGSLPG
jgi:putative flippase GtrA